jgi:hypothetical protein
MKNFIYSLSDPLTKEIVYIGKTKNPKKRFKDHCRIDLRNRCNLDKWKNKIISQGFIPEMEIIEEVICENVNDREKFYIDFYLSSGSKLLNMTEGGDGLQNPSEEVRKKIGEKSRGRKMSDYVRKKIFESTYNSGIAILCYNKDGKFIGEFKNARRAQEELGVGYKSISAIINKKRYFINGYTFFPKNETNIESELKKRIEKTTDINKSFFRISENGDKKLYNNILEASRENKCNFRNIWLCLNNNRKTCVGYAWVYEDSFNGNYSYFFERKTRSK